MTIISSGIYPIDPTITDGTQLAGYINELVEAINSNQASSTRPPMISKGGLWTKTLTGSDIAIMVYDGTNDVEIGKVTGGEIIIGGGGDSIWTEVDGVAIYDGAVDLGTPELEQKLNVYNIGTSKYGFGGIPNFPRMYFPDDGNLQFGTIAKDGTDTFTSLMQLSNGGAVTTNADMFVNGIRVGQGGGAYALPENTVLGVDVLAGNVSGTGNTGIGSNALRFNTAGGYNTAVGLNAVNKENGGRNTAVGSNALGSTTGTGNTSIGESSGSATLSGNNNTMLGSGAQPSSATVSNEVTIGNGDVTLTRLRGKIHMTGEASWQTSGSASPNVFINSGTGELIKTTTTFYSTEEVDKKLAIKDKLLEKLEARLKKIEDQLKKKK